MMIIFSFVLFQHKDNTWVRFMVFNTTFSNISVISWLSVLLVDETTDLNNRWIVGDMFSQIPNPQFENKMTNDTKDITSR
jgi:hypothetical protein